MAVESKPRAIHSRSTWIYNSLKNIYLKRELILFKVNRSCFMCGMASQGVKCCWLKGDEGGKFHANDTFTHFIVLLIMSDLDDEEFAHQLSSSFGIRLKLFAPRYVLKLLQRIQCSYFSNKYEKKKIVEKSFMCGNRIEKKMKCRWIWIPGISVNNPCVLRH